MIRHINIRNIIWDLDGTLVDTYPAFVSAFGAALADLGHHPEPGRILELALVGLTHCAETLSRVYQVPLAAVEGGFSRHYSGTRSDQQPLMPGAQAVCARVIEIGGKNLVVTHRRRDSAKSLLEAHGLHSLVADLIGGDDGFPGKPDPSGFISIMARNGVPPDETISVGDRAIDVEAGAAAGVRTCQLGRIESRVEADYRVTHLSELLEIVCFDRA